MIKQDFHISKSARIKYNFDDSFYSLRGNLVIANSQSARFISNRINEKRKSEGAFDQLVTTGEVNALGILHEVYHFLINHYAEVENPGVINRGIKYLMSEINPKNLADVLLKYIEQFPPLDVYKGKITKANYFNGETGGKSNRGLILQELIILHFENSNPAAVRLNELFSDKLLKENTSYNNLITKAEEFFDKEEPTGFGGLHLFSVLRKPISDHPYNLEEQLDFIRRTWGIILDEKLLGRLLKGSDLIKEDYKLFIKHGGGEKATPPVPDYKFELEEMKKDSDDHLLGVAQQEKFTEDTHWMPEVVMIAKNIFVWMHQLSEKYKYEIKHLDQIPDAELDQLAEWNFTALWLIGIWERSNASKEIKRLTGNPEAAASAYSLFDYVIANELGGEDSFNNLKHRAGLRGIRLASDMVPNHTGIFSKWIIEKPDYFIRASVPPYHNYSFTGQNLSEDDRIEIRIEDKYYTREDAAVVFQRRDTRTGEVYYIYHGNDGTNMPWNDTAQLNLLNPEVRESLYQTIKHVAQKTPIIRFDAAMTLSQKHYQRLWFPESGKGGAIPSRSDYSMTKKEFHQNMPVEFWREVVDRFNSEMPNTLLLAEAFWLMEGYFVRTLGMHRVYNSAFMHMMMKEENDKYRKLISNTLEFNPEILKRYVNFMSNPDEETAINQFGKGDKYFGVAVMMVTLPGLPMFGHGQIEGFSEKYGMEYKRAYYHETLDEHLIWRHKKEIFPLMNMRHLFSQVDNFELYDFANKDGILIEDILAYSNRSGNETALVIYNNSYNTYEGIIKYTNLKYQDGRVNPRKTIASIFNFQSNPKHFYIYTDHRTQLQFLVSGKELNEQGFRIKMFGYQYRICLNFKEVYDGSGVYQKLYDSLNGRGVGSIDHALYEMEMIPLHSSLEEFLAPPNIREIRNYIYQTDEDKAIKKKRRDYQVSPSIRTGLVSVVEALKNYDVPIPEQNISDSFFKKLDNVKTLYDIWMRYVNRKKVAQWMMEANLILSLHPENKDNEAVCTYLTLLTIDNLLVNGTNDRIENYNTLLLSKPVINILSRHTAEDNSRTNSELIKSLIVCKNDFKNINIRINKRRGKEPKGKKRISALQQLPLSNLIHEGSVSSFLQVNKYDEITYFNKERFELIIKWLFQLVIFEAVSSYNEIVSKAKETKEKNNSSRKLPSKQELERVLMNTIRDNHTSIKNLIWLAEESGYNIEKFSNSLIEIGNKNKINKETETDG